MVRGRPLHTIDTALRAGAIAAGLSALTTLLLWLLPQYAAPPIEGVRISAVDPIMVVTKSINLLHVHLALAGYAAAAYLLSRHSAALSCAALTLFGFWAALEAIAVSISLWTITLSWKAGYLAAGVEERAAIEAAILAATGIWEALFFLVLTSFFLATTMLGLACLATSGLGRAQGILLLLAAPLTIAIVCDGYFGVSLAPFIDWTYPVLQPVSRSVLAIWIWQAIGRLAG